MTRITLEQLSNFINSGATLDDTLSMIEMLKVYKNEIEEGIASWQELIPEVVGDRASLNDSPYNWGDRARRKQLGAIVRFLREQGYVPQPPTIQDDQDTCSWAIAKGDRSGLLGWNTQRGTYQLTGLPAPKGDYEGAIELPTNLDWK